MEKGQTNNPGGRPKGRPDKRNLRVAERAADLGCDPIEFLCFVVLADVEKLKELPDLDQRIIAAKELASYIAPKLKSVEHTGEAIGSFFEKLLERRSGDKPDA
jgi:hypothetical protein